WARRYAIPTGAMLCLSVVYVCLSSLPYAARAQPGGDRWVMLATRAIDAKAGRASIDLSRAKGAFRAVRVSLRTGALALTQIDLKYEGGVSHTARRALVLRHNQPPRVIDTHSDDRFLDSLVLAFRNVAGEPDRAILVIEGLQTPSGAAAVRGRPGSPPGFTARRQPPEPPPVDAKRRGGGLMEEEEARRRSSEEARKAAPPPTPPVAAARPPAPAAPPPTPAAP